MIIGNTMFEQQKEEYKLWISPVDSKRYQIDYIGSTNPRKVSKMLEKCEDPTRSVYQFRPCPTDRRSRYSTEEDKRKTGDKEI